MPSKVKDIALARTSGTLEGTDKFYVAAEAGDVDAQVDLSELTAYIAAQVEAGVGTAELIRDTIAIALAAGAGITVTPNDGADTITIASTITQYTDEMARDAIGTALVEGTGIDVAVNDGGDTITITKLEEWAPNFTADADAYIPALVAMTISAGNAAIGTGAVAYEKSTTAAPGTFASTTLPATLEAGAWLKVIATGVDGFYALHLRRTA